MPRKQRLIFRDAERARDSIMASQKQEIAQIYQDWADEVGRRADYYKRKTTPSSVVSEHQLRELERMMRETSEQVANEVYNGIKHNIYLVADSVVRCNDQWLASLGFNSALVHTAFSDVADMTVRNLITGQIYEGGWNLSKAIWGDNEKTLKDIYTLVARGRAENRSIYDIAKSLEQYVSPGKKKNWNPVIKMINTKTGKPEYKRIYKSQVDYNAQRLARTLVQHGYQQSFIATTQKNPFITDYVWHSNGSRPCELCQSRDGVHYRKDHLPMDHPNGMCTMEPVVATDLNDQLINWFNSPDGTFPEIDEFAKNFGYNP